MGHTNVHKSMRINREDKECQIESDNLLEWLMTKRFEQFKTTTATTEKLVDIILSSTPSTPSNKLTKN